MQAIIFLNGTLPATGIIRSYIEKKKIIIAADGGANSLRKIKIVPDVIIGDMDSVKRETVNYFRTRNTEIIRIEEQDTTDFEKSLRYCMKFGYEKIIVFGATGTRTDHTLNNFSVLQKYYRRLELKFITDDFEIFFIRKKIRFVYKKNKIISLMGVPEAKKIFSTGLKYQLKNDDLKFGQRDGALNVSISNKVGIRFQSGNLLLFKKHFI